MRFSSNGKKLRTRTWWNMMNMVQLCEIQTPDKSQSTEISWVSYKLVAVVVHTDNKLFSGHYVCYMKRNSPLSLGGHFGVLGE